MRFAGYVDTYQQLEASFVRVTAAEVNISLRRDLIRLGENNAKERLTWKATTPSRTRLKNTPISTTPRRSGASTPYEIMAVCKVKRMYKVEGGKGKSPQDSRWRKKGAQSLCEITSLIDAEVLYFKEWQIIIAPGSVNDMPTATERRSLSLGERRWIERMECIFLSHLSIF
jgi:hypothetical protein